MSSSHIRNRQSCQRCDSYLTYSRRSAEWEARDPVHLCGRCRKSELNAAIDLELPEVHEGR